MCARHEVGYHTPTCPSFKHHFFHTIDTFVNHQLLRDSSSHSIKFVHVCATQSIQYTQDRIYTWGSHSFNHTRK